MLSDRGIRATFKVVGEKARTLERRGRQDVIAALKHHAIAFHSDFHSVHPTPSEYLADCGLLDGIAEFVRREGDGAADVRRIFGVDTLACYGQPGSSWAPQAVAGLKAIGVAPSGVPCYVDDGDHVGLNGTPFWYAGALNVYDMGPNTTRMDLHDPASLEPSKQKFTAIAERLARQPDGGLISIYFHPCEWVHVRFWDSVNFSRGRNPPRSEWTAPPQLPENETDAAFLRFGEYIDHMRSTPGVRFVTASDLPNLYPDKARTDGCTRAELDELTDRILGRKDAGLDYQLLGHKAFSLADQFEIFTEAAAAIDARTSEGTLPVHGLDGPDGPPPSSGAGERHLPWPAFQAAALDVRDFIAQRHRVPARVFVGADPIAPADFLVALAAALDLARHPVAPGSAREVIVPEGTEVLPARHVARDTPGLFGGWIIHRDGFRAPKLLGIARIEAWTLKPALRIR